jgi:hypothetical protein
MPHWGSTKPSEKEDWVSSALGVDKFHRSAQWGGGKTTSSLETGVIVAKTSTGAAEEFPEGKPYLVDAGPNEARKRMRDTMAPPNHKTQVSTYPLISHWEFPTVVTG